ncbi:MAG: hypothetical protein SVR94_14115 [Pseudomonadota bacterium]|nr:hypothetical protein [Pseudomonadota bacterium]
MNAGFPRQRCASKNGSELRGEPLLNLLVTLILGHSLPSGLQIGGLWVQGARDGSGHRPCQGDRCPRRCGAVP